MLILRVAAHVLIVVTCTILSYNFVYATLSKTKSKKKELKDTSTKDKNNVLSSTASVIDRGLVVQEPTLASILAEHDQYCHVCREEKLTPADVLGYVTPWNNHGYDVAKTFAAKMTMISPVWLQITASNKQYSIRGKHDIDKGWIKDVKRGNKDIKMMPRLLFDGWSAQDFQALFTSEAEMQEVADVILFTLQEHKFSGVVLEIWSQLGFYFRSELVHFLQHLARQLHGDGRKLVLVVPPPIDKDESSGRRSMFDKADFDRLKAVVDAFSLMTYDYSTPERPGLNAPLPWMRRCVEHLVPEPRDPDRLKLLLGLNFYGYHYDSFTTGHPASVMEPVVANKFLEVVRTYKPKVKWHEEGREATFTYKVGGVEQTVAYPTLRSVQDRLDLARDLNTGVSIWELGQGLDYFYDLL